MPALFAATRRTPKSLWHHLRNRQLGGFKFRRQATVGPHIVDFLCTELRLIVEADGGQHHPEVDRERTDFLASRGYQVLRFWNNDVLENTTGVLEALFAASEERRKTLTQPSPAYGRGHMTLLPRTE